MNSEKQLLINNFIELIKKSTANASDNIIVNKAILIESLSYLNLEQLGEILKKMILPPPTIESPDFRIWVKETREKLGLTQESMAEATNIAQGDLSSFEKGKKPFGKKRAEKVLGVLIEKKQSLYA